MPPDVLAEERPGRESEEEPRRSGRNPHPIFLSWPHSPHLASEEVSTNGASGLQSRKTGTHAVDDGENYRGEHRNTQLATTLSVSDLQSRPATGQFK